MLIDKAMEKGYKYVQDYPNGPKDIEKYKGVFPQNAEIRDCENTGFGEIRLNDSVIAVLLK